MLVNKAVSDARRLQQELKTVDPDAALVLSKALDDLVWFLTGRPSAGRNGQPYRPMPLRKRISQRRLSEYAERALDDFFGPLGQEISIRPPFENLVLASLWSDFSALCQNLQSLLNQVVLILLDLQRSYFERPFVSPDYLRVSEDSEGEEPLKQRVDDSAVSFSEELSRKHPGIVDLLEITARRLELMSLQHRRLDGIALAWLVFEERADNEHSLVLRIEEEINLRQTIAWLSYLEALLVVASRNDQEIIRQAKIERLEIGSLFQTITGVPLGVVGKVVEFVRRGIDTEGHASRIENQRVQTAGLRIDNLRKTVAVLPELDELLSENRVSLEEYEALRAALLGFNEVSIRAIELDGQEVLASPAEPLQLPPPGKPSMAKDE